MKNSNQLIIGVILGIIGTGIIGGGLLSTGFIGGKSAPITKKEIIEGFKKLPPDDLVNPIRDFLKDGKIQEFFKLSDPSLIGESHAGGTGHDSRRGIKTNLNPQWQLLDGGGAQTTAFFHVAIPDSVVNTEGEVDVIFKLFEGNQAIENVTTSIKVEGNNGTNTYSNSASITSEDFIDNESDPTSFVNFSVSATLNSVTLGSIYSIVLEMSNHHAQSEPTVAVVDDHLEIIRSLSSIIPYECMMISSTNLEKYDCYERYPNLHISQHVEKQILTLGK